MIKTKILYCVNDLNNAGPTTQLYNIIKHIDLIKFEIKLITLKKISNFELKEKFSKIVKVTELESEKTIEKLKKEIDNFSPNFVQTSGFFPDRYISKINNKKKYKHIITVRSNTKLEYTKRYGRLKGFFYFLLHKKAFKKSDYLISCSSHIKKILLSHKLNSKLIHNGVDTDLYKCNKRKQKDIINFLSVGKFVYEKNQELLLRVFNEITRTHKNISLTLFGDGPNFKELKEKYIHNKKITFKGNVPNLVQEYCDYDVFVSTSISEGMPNVALEAISSGLLVALSDISPHLEIKDILKEDIIIFKNNFLDLHDKLISIIEKNKKSINLNHSIKTTDFSAVNMSKRYMRLYSNGNL